MSIHACKCGDEWHLRYPGLSEEEAQNIADRINSGALTDAEKLLPLQRQVAMLWKLLDESWQEKYLNGIELRERCNQALANTQATAEAYDREHAEKVLEKAKSDDLQNELAKRNFVSMPKNVYEVIRQHTNAREDAIRWCEEDMKIPCAANKKENG